METCGSLMAVRRAGIAKIVKERRKGCQIFVG